MAIKHSHVTRLTDAQCAVLAAAAQRPDASIVLPAHLKGKAPQKLAQALLDKALVAEVRARSEQPVWRRDQDSGQSFALVLTKVGRTLAAKQADGDPQAPGEAPKSKTSSPTVPRQGSKLAAVIALLGREEGTSVSELMAATGWLPHTTRAALTGLRKRGYALTRETAEGGPVYRIGAASAATV